MESSKAEIYKGNPSPPPGPQDTNYLLIATLADIKLGGCIHTFGPQNPCKNEGFKP